MPAVGDVVQYNQRREAVEQAVRGMPTGTQLEISYDIRRSPSIISGVLSGRYVDQKVLAEIEQWVRGRVPEGVGR